MDQYTYICEVQSVSSLFNDINNAKKVNLCPLYQRDIVWEISDKSFFINSIIKGVATNCLTFTKNSDGKVCIDGKQRCNSIVEFVTNKIYVETDEIKYFYGPTKKEVEYYDKKEKDEDDTEIKIL